MPVLGICLAVEIFYIDARMYWMTCFGLGVWQQFIGMTGSNINHAYLQLEVGVLAVTPAPGSDCSVAGMAMDVLGSLDFISVLINKGELSFPLAR